MGHPLRFQSTNVQPITGLPPPVTTGGTQSFIDSSGDVWVAKPGVYNGTWQRARDVLFSRWQRNNAWSLQTAMTVFGYDTVASDLYGMYNSSTGLWTVPVAGIYRCDMYIGIGTAATNSWIQIDMTGTFPQIGAFYYASAGSQYLESHVSGTGVYPVNGQIGVSCNGSTVMSGMTGSATFGEIMYIGHG